MALRFVDGRTPFAGAPRGIPVVYPAIRLGVARIKRDIADRLEACRAVNDDPESFRLAASELCVHFSSMILTTRWRRLATKMARHQARRMLDELTAGKQG